MKRHQVQRIALVLMWVGGIEIVVSFLVHYWFSYDIPYTPVFFLFLILGIVSYLVTRVF